MSSPLDRKTCPVIGISVDVGSMLSIAQRIIDQSKNPKPSGGYVCVANVHMLTIAHQNRAFKAILENANLVLADGMPLVWTQKFKGHKNAERICGPDFMMQLCEMLSQANQSIYLLGSDSQTLTLLSQQLINRFSALTIAGMYAPGFLLEEPALDLQLVEKINTSGASVLLVGLGCPKQEFWCALHAPFLKPIAIGVGAAFDFHAGTKSRPPLWLQKSGLEWLYRLLAEPKRLWKRYLISNTQFLSLSVTEFFKWASKTR